MATKATEKEGTWVTFTTDIEPLVKQHPEFALFIVVRWPFWRRSHFRCNRPLPVARVELSQNTWELCIHAPGLIKEKPVSSSPIQLAPFHECLSAHVASSPHCTLVVSDERDIDIADVPKLFGGKGEWSGLPLEDIEEEELHARLDLPILEIAIKVLPDERSIHLCLKV